jgi:NAD(P)H-nitrite reductase large subunit
VGLTAGVSPNIALAAESSLETGRGILVDDHLRTSSAGIFAAGDCAEIVTPGEGRHLVQQVWYTGKMQGEAVGDVIAGHERPYIPGIWYNSAKFLDLEYQVYGQVNMGVEDEKNIFWGHANGLHSARIVHVGGQVIGFNFMGMRYRHEVCEGWIREERSVQYVLDHLEEANFDPEFFRRHEHEMVPALKRQVA